jgi:hypothetical protein
MLRRSLIMTGIGWVLSGSGMFLHAHSFLWLGGIALGMGGAMLAEWLGET